MGPLSLLPSTSCRSLPQLLPLLLLLVVLVLAAGATVPALAVLTCGKLPKLAPLLPLLLLPPLLPRLLLLPLTGVAVRSVTALAVLAPALLPSSCCGQLADLGILLLLIAAVGCMGALALPPTLRPCSKLPSLPLLWCGVLTNPVRAGSTEMLSQLRSRCSTKLLMPLLLLLLVLTAAAGGLRAGMLAQLRSGCSVKLPLLLLMSPVAALGALPLRLSNSCSKLARLGLKGLLPPWGALSWPPCSVRSMLARLLLLVLVSAVLAAGAVAPVLGWVPNSTCSRWLVV